MKKTEFQGNLYLIGYRACGKSTIAKICSEKLERKMVSIDVILKKELGNFDKFVELHGWGPFREKESSELRKISQQKNLVVDCGGGIIENPDNIKMMRSSGKVIWLTASEKTIAERMGKDKPTKEDRPSLTGKDRIEEISEVLNRRKKLYEAASDFCIDTEDFLPDQAALELIRMISYEN